MVHAARTPGTQALTLCRDGRERQVLVRVPPAVVGEAPLPVVLVFHGGGGKAEHMLEACGWAAAADADGFLAVVPQGTRRHPDRPAHFRANPQTWNDGSLRPRISAEQRAICEVAFVEALIAELPRRWSIDERRIFATGFSNGASLTFLLGRELSTVLAAIAPVAGTDWCRDRLPQRPPPLFCITGTDDPLNPFAGGEAVFAGRSYGVRDPVEAIITAWADLHAIDTEPVVVHGVDGARRASYRDAAGLERVALLALLGHGHHWPGGKTLLPESMVGPNASGVDACAAIWDFFSAVVNATGPSLSEEG